MSDLRNHVNGGIFISSPIAASSISERVKRRKETKKNKSKYALMKGSTSISPLDSNVDTPMCLCKFS